MRLVAAVQQAALPIFDIIHRSAAAVYEVPHTSVIFRSLLIERGFRIRLHGICVASHGNIILCRLLDKPAELIISTQHGVGIPIGWPPITILAVRAFYQHNLWK